MINFCPFLRNASKNKTDYPMLQKRASIISMVALRLVEVAQSRQWHTKGPSTLATLFNHMWPRIVAGIFIPVGNHYFQALASTLQFVAQVCDRLWLVPATDRAFAYITYMSPPHVALVCSGPPQCAATCGWTKWPVCSGPNARICVEISATMDPCNDLYYQQSREAFNLTGWAGEVLLNSDLTSRLN